jgi:outer membrane lipoprotein-sorting protein
MASTVEAMNSRATQVEPVPTTSSTSRRRLSMARYLRFGSALAAMALLATLAALLFFTTPQASAWQEVIKELKKAESVTFDESQVNHMTLTNPPFIFKHFVQGEWERSNDLFFNSIRVVNQKTGDWLHINGYNKTYDKGNHGPDYQEQRKLYKPDTFINQLIKLSGLPHTEAGEEKINGVSTRKIVINDAKLAYTGDMTLWYDVKTKLPVRIIHEVSDTHPRITRTLTNFQWNVPLDGKLFTPEIPKDYVEDKREPAAK